jgi:two-component system phosphate regulon response regulator OmpR
MSEPLARVLIADDEADLRALLHRYLGEQGYAVRAVENVAQAERLLARERYDVLVLDVMMPGEDGLSACRRLRVHGETIPILMLTARGDPVDRVVGLEMGADDYLAKPFNPRELAARIRALVRRQRLLGAHHGPVTDEGGEVRFGPFVLRLDQRRLLRGQKEVPLSTAEFALLRALALQPRRPLGRDRLLQLAYGPRHEATERSIDVQVMRLRKLVEADPSNPRHIRTVWGVGYEFVPDADAR